MLICPNCGDLIEEEELRYYYEDGRRLPYPCHCGSDYEEARKCKVCGEYFYEEEYRPEYICDECLEDEACTSYALEIGENNTESVEINGYVATLLKPEEINKILTDYVKANFPECCKQATKYCIEDKQSFSEFVAERI